MSHKPVILKPSKPSPDSKTGSAKKKKALRVIMPETTQPSSHLRTLTVEEAVDIRIMQAQLLELRSRENTRIKEQLKDLDRNQRLLAERVALLEGMLSGIRQPSADEGEEESDDELMRNVHKPLKTATASALRPDDMPPVLLSATGARGTKSGKKNPDTSLFAREPYDNTDYKTSKRRKKKRVLKKPVVSSEEGSDEEDDVYFD